MAFENSGYPPRGSAPIVSPAAWYLEGLNPRQREAVESLDGPLLVLAGAGVGKTRVLTTRIAHILATGGARGWEILAVTFTNKAAKAMLERIQGLIGAADGAPWMGTFHSIGAKLLRRHAELAGLQPNFSILDSDDQLRLMKEALKAADIDEKRWPARGLAAQIDSWKNRAIEPKHVSKAEAAGFANGKGAALYEAYQARLKALNAVDFGDLLLESLKLLRDHPDLLESYQRRFKYILVDEYQDTNHVQYMWLRLIAAAHRNVCCVGDDDQAIYGWRGADVDNILRFEKDFQGAKVIRLENNYRSTGHILAAASGLIAHNHNRLGKTLYTERDDGERPVVFGVWDGAEEAREIGDEIERAQRAGTSLSEIAVLVRASFQMRELEERFIEIGLAYRVVGGPRFYERAEIRDAIGYLRAITQPNDDLAFERIFNTPKRGLGDATLVVLQRHARARGVSLFIGARSLVEETTLKPKSRAALRTLIAHLDRWATALDQMRPDALAQMVILQSGLIAMWEAEKTEEARGRLENLRELARSIGEFESIGVFLEHVSLVFDAERGDPGPRVSIMTLHSAKGLEFDYVFLPGWEEGVFPHPRSMEENGLAGLEEERRLAYVGLTRARRRAFMFHAANRRVRGNWQSSIPSRFVAELPQDHVKMRDSEARGYWIPSAPPSFTPRQPIVASRPQLYTSPSVSAPAPRSPNALGRKANADVKPGARVFHLKFGPGTVLEEDNGHLTIEFDHAGCKTVMAAYVELA